MRSATGNGAAKLANDPRRASAALTARPPLGSRFTLLIVDENPIYRLGLRAAFQSAPDFSIVDETGDGDTAIALALRTQPSAVILDGQIRGVRSGVDVAREIHARLPRTKVIALSSSAKETHVIAMIDVGVNGYLLKDIGPVQIVESLRVILAGRTVFSGPVSSRLAARLTHPNGVPALTRREMQTLALLAGGMQNGEMAAALGITAKAVQLHLTNIYGKLGVRNRTEAVVLGAKRGLVAIEDG